MNKLYRSRTDKMVAGVAGGLARYLRIDTTLVIIPVSRNLILNHRGEKQGLDNNRE